MSSLDFITDKIQYYRHRFTSLDETTRQVREWFPATFAEAVEELP